jgi:transposase-like protein
MQGEQEVSDIAPPMFCPRCASIRGRAMVQGVLDHWHCISCRRTWSIEIVSDPSDGPSQAYTDKTQNSFGKD